MPLPFSGSLLRRTKVMVPVEMRLDVGRVQTTKQTGFCVFTLSKQVLNYLCPAHYWLQMMAVLNLCECDIKT
ncbi:hypothetical protein M378DRAFT_745140 [Amanita muscaria Koide BX008]|uniref:Uncharacterized protein n=1 Tax=Amanita muscaria (strain Koide BX008) TaxID=946122 RepID=A0A0C2WMM3_AMAMK|nr:hypothetical protein M378DRAFT_745140 [Amanita muscaria Koide BX008]